MRLALLSLVISACAGAAQPGAALPDAPDAARSAPDAAPVAAPTPPALRVDDADAPPPAVTPEPTMRVTATASRLPGGEVALDLRSEGWPGRGESPALLIGDRRVEDSEHTHPTVLRFVVPADVAWIAGTPASVAYGDDEVARFELPEVAP